ncbi:hypothetical protein HYU19_00805 [Candidatus Woesearchaeota archaeon]|nr:hypothetical protein [Candidatus Woesearchaeota archaeon]
MTPTDHQYIIPKETKSKSLVTDDPYRYEVRAPADGYIINIELFKEPVEINYQDQPYINNYLVFFEHSCTFYTRLIHIDTLAPDIEAKVEFRNAESQHPNAFPRIPVKKGQAIGTVGPHSFDFQIMDTSIKNKFIAPEHTQTWTLYTVDTFDYLAEPLRSALLAKNIKMTEPYGGKIMYDKDGTLLGNWRRIGRDASNSQYWQDDLSIVYDHIDPSQIQVSIGNFGGSPQAFSVRGNAPAPESVNKEKGMVVYGLAETKYYTESGELWDEIRFAKLSAKNSDYLVGTVAFQLESDRVLKMEAFPGKTADDVRGFTEKVVRYER